MNKPENENNKPENENKPEAPVTHRDIADLRRAIFDRARMMLRHIPGNNVLTDAQALRELLYVVEDFENEMSARRMVFEMTEAMRDFIAKVRPRVETSGNTELHMAMNAATHALDRFAPCDLGEAD